MTSTFALFAAPPEKDVDWLDAGVEGQSRFLGRVYRFATRNLPVSECRGDGAADAKILGSLVKLLPVTRAPVLRGRWH